MLNKVKLIGNLGADPEAKPMPNGGNVVTLSIATTRRWKDRNTGEQKTSTEWHRVVCFNRTADIASQYLNKGSQVYIEGRIQTRKWQAQDGADRYTTEVVADSLLMLGKKDLGSSESSSVGADNSSTTHKLGDFTDDELDEIIPF
mgnify:CR=1 FL=1